MNLPSLLRCLLFWLLLCGVIRAGDPQQNSSSVQAEQAHPKKIVLVAGKPSHPPRTHEFNAGVQLLAKCLNENAGIDAQFVLNGWPENEAIFDGASSIVFYMDGGSRHEIAREEGRRLQLLDKLVQSGTGIGFMHYAVEVEPKKAGRELHKWIGGYYETLYSCNPIWEPSFESFPAHPTTRGVKPFQLSDEWYFNMRFVRDIDGGTPSIFDDVQFVPTLVAIPDSDVRDGPYVAPKGPYEHIIGNVGRSEAMLWTVESNNHRGFGFTGGHFHDNWKNDSFRKIVLNTIAWSARVEVPAEGIQSTVTNEMLDENLDRKR